MEKYKGKQKRRRQILKRGLLLAVIGIGLTGMGVREVYMQMENSRREICNSKEKTILLGRGEEKAVREMKAVKCILQNPELPTGCEATAGTILLQAYGYDIDKLDVADHMKRLPLEEKDGRLYGAHPDDYFIGEPDTLSGYGAFPQVLADAMQSLIDQNDGKHRAVPLYGQSEEELLARVDQGIPVCIWSSSKNLEIEHRRGWYLIRDGEYTDEYFQWPSNEHVLVLTAYNETEVTVCDPQQGVVRYPRESFFRHYKQVGAYALVLEEM